MVCVGRKSGNGNRAMEKGVTHLLLRLRGERLGQGAASWHGSDFEAVDLGPEPLDLDAVHLQICAAADTSV